MLKSIFPLRMVRMAFPFPRANFIRLSARTFYETLSAAGVTLSNAPQTRKAQCRHYTGWNSDEFSASVLGLWWHCIAFGWLYRGSITISSHAISACGITANRVFSCSLVCRTCRYILGVHF